MTAYRFYDIFTDTAFGGNQLAVVPDATTLPEYDLQRITAEFNFSKTTFVYPPVDQAHTPRVRIFTATMEIPFAGHPTIGTAIALRDLGAQRGLGRPSYTRARKATVTVTINGNAIRTMERRLVY